MGKLLGIVLSQFAGGLLKKLLLGAGLGIVTGAIVLAVISHYVAKLTQQAGLLGAMAGILHLGGMDTAISIIIGAVIVRATLSAAKVSITKS